MHLIISTISFFAKNVHHINPAFNYCLQEIYHVDEILNVIYVWKHNAINSRWLL